jgi:hypothetical protein
VPPEPTGPPIRVDFDAPVAQQQRPVRSPVPTGAPRRVDFDAPLAQQQRPVRRPVPTGAPRRVDFEYVAAGSEPGSDGGPWIPRLALVGGILAVVLIGSAVGLAGGLAVGSHPQVGAGVPSPTASATGSAPSATLASPDAPKTTGAPIKTAQPTAGVKATATPVLKQTPKPTAVPTQKPVVAFLVSPSSAFGACKSGLTAFDLTLDNSKSNVAVSWSVAFGSSAYPTDWGSAKPSKGVVPAGQSATVSITPQDLCSAIKSQTDFTLEVLYASSGKAAVTYTVVP